MTANGVGDAFAFVAPFGDGWYRVFAWNRRDQVPDDAPLKLGEIAEVTRLALTDGTRPYQELDGKRFVLVNAPAGWADDRVRTAAAAVPCTVLVRPDGPDGYVAWAAENADPATIESVLAQWCD